MILGFIIGSVVASGLIFWVQDRRISHLLVILYSLFLLSFSLFLGYGAEGYTEDYFGTEPEALLFLGLSAVIAGISAFHYQQYARLKNISAKTVRLHNAGMLLFLASIAGVLLSSSFGVLWVFIESSTISAAILIYHDRHKRSLEATWKYIFICSVGAALAFAGIQFLSLGAHDIEGNTLNFAAIKANAALIDPTWLKACFLFILAGFSVKMGIVPLFNVDIDAKDVSPAPVGALLSAVLSNAGFFAIYRFFDAFSGTEIHAWMQHILLLCGFASLLLVAAYALKVSNLKRLLAYSSMEHAAIAVIAVASGPKGWTLALAHLFFHSIFKSVLFFQAGHAGLLYGSKDLRHIGSYLHISPLGGLVFLVTFMMVLGLPPSGMFFTELGIISQVNLAFGPYASILLCGLLLFIFFGMARRIFPFLFLGRGKIKFSPQVFRSSSVLQLLLVGAAILICAGLVCITCIPDCKNLIVSHHLIPLFYGSL